VIVKAPPPVGRDSRLAGAEGEPVRLRFWGTLDHLRAAGASDTFRRVRAGQRVIVDLERVTFIDSAGLRMLADGIRWVGASGGNAVLEGPSPWLRKILHVVGVDRLAPVTTTVSDPAPA
jgi:anti-anti-sigma factor